MKKQATILGMAMAAWFAGGATAATQLNGLDIFVTGSRQTDNTAGGLGGFSPGTGLGPNGSVAELRMYDDGLTNGDVTADDGLWTCAVTNLNPGDLLQWKVAAAGFPPAANTPNNNNALIVPADGTVTFYLQTTPQNDDFIPDAGVGSAPNGFIYTDETPAMLASYTSLEATGGFQSELGFGADWSAATAPVLTDAAIGTTGDNLIGVVLNAVPCGTYEYKITANQGFDPSSTTSGFSFGGGNLGWNSPADGDTVTITMNTITGRVSTVSALTEAASAGPPFFATSSAWGICQDAATQLTASGPTTFQRTFTVAAAGSYQVRVRQGVGRSFPDTGDYPFETTAPNQVVRVIFDRAAYTDGFSPSTDFVVVLDDATRAPLNTWTKVQPVGTFQGDFGSGDWNANEAALDLVDDGANGDGAAGDGIFAKSFSAFGTATGDQFKAVGRRTGHPEDATEDGGFHVQFGGADDGLTIDGNNDTVSIDFTTGTAYTFVVDTATGRVGFFPTASTALPTRDSYFSTTSSVGDWMAY